MGTTRRTSGYPVSAIVAVLVALCAVACPAARSAAVTQADIFTVAGIPVDATASNAVAARDAARIDGERRAFRILLERLTLAADRGRLPRVGDQQLTELVRDFEVADERSSGVRYLANYSFRFRADSVRALLRDAGIPFAETVSKPVVVLAVLRRDEAVLLWDDPNPWRAAWSDYKGAGGLVPFVVPLGDATDVAAIGGDQALAADRAALARVAVVHGSGDVLIAAATRQPSGELQTTLRRVAAGGPSDIPGATFQPSAGESEGEFMARVVAASAASVEEAWRRDNVLATGKEDVLTAAVPLNGLADWVLVRDRLKGVPAIKRTEVVALDKQNGRLEIHYLGDPARLRLALAQRDLILDGGAEAWTLRLRGGTARAADNPPQ